MWPYLSGMEFPCAVLSSVACRAVPFFFHVCHKRHDFRWEKSDGDIKRVLIWSASSVENVSHSEKK